MKNSVSKLNSSSLVSVGIPTYNRPEKLCRTLESITQQSYMNLEIIISDNCSEDSKVKSIVEDYKKKDNRIHFFQQSKNIGMINNFQFVLQKATGDFFMWAADDDQWTSDFIEILVNLLEENGDTFVAAMVESQYVVDGNRINFFPEGEAFYNFYSLNRTERIRHIIKFNYGNLFYSLFRRKAIQKAGDINFTLLENSKSIFNEISLFIIIAFLGNWKVIPKIKFYKDTKYKTYLQARWEQEGGSIPQSGNLEYYKGLIHVLRYHISTMNYTLSTLRLLEFNWRDRFFLNFQIVKELTQHFIYLVIRKKHKKFRT